MRLPVKVFGDLRAQLAACHIAEQRVLDLVARYGADAFSVYMTELVDYAERMTRAALARTAGRRLCLFDHLSTTTASMSASRSALFVTHHQDGRPASSADWTGTSPQVKGAINNTLSFTKSATYCGDPLGAAGQHPEQRGRVPRDRGHRAAGHDRQRRAAGRLRGARPDRLSHGRLHVRRARA